MIFNASSCKIMFLAYGSHYIWDNYLSKQNEFHPYNLPSLRLFPFNPVGMIHIVAHRFIGGLE